MVMAMSRHQHQIPHESGHKAPVTSCYSIPIQPSEAFPITAGTTKNERDGKLIIGKELSVKGQVESCKGLFVHGHLESAVECEVLKVTDNGELIGQAVVSEADIYGIFNGTLSVAGCLTIRANGSVHGNVQCGELRVERGGVVDGEIKFSKSSIQPKDSLFQRACLHSGVQNHV